MANVAIMGFGTIGFGTAEVLTKNSDIIAKRIGEPVNLKYILDIRDFPDSPYASKLIKDFAIIENDPEIDVVVECIGGTGVSRDFTLRAIKAGKSVVTSNKALVAKCAPEIFPLAVEKNVSYLFEASVGGGIPIIHPLTQCLAANNINDIMGILNGTCNYILTQMSQKDLDFDVALKQAQKLGYAEADPTDDVEGIDTARKIAILCSICFNRHVISESIPCKGISKITKDDLAFASCENYAIRLLGRGVSGENPAIFVSPHFVPSTNPLYGVNDAFNSIFVDCDMLGTSMFYGKGAGDLPTASAVVSDVIEAIVKKALPKKAAWDTQNTYSVKGQSDFVSRYYVRCSSLPTIDGIKLLSGGNGIAFITLPMSVEEIEALSSKVNAEIYMPVMD